MHPVYYPSSDYNRYRKSHVFSLLKVRKLMNAVVILYYLPVMAVLLAQCRAESKMAHGSLAKKGQFPYVVAVVEHNVGSTAMCSGSLITFSCVLTCCHCLANIDERKDIKLLKDPYYTKYYVIAGEIDLSRPKAANVRDSHYFNINAMCFIQPIRNRVLMDDVGLIRVKTPFFLVPGVIEVVPFATFRKAKAQLLLDYIVKKEEYVTMVGFGRTEKGWNWDLRYGDLRVRSDLANCWQGSRKSTIGGISEAQYFRLHGIECANHPKIPRGARKGDSGGPVLYKDRYVGMIMGGRVPGEGNRSNPDTHFVRLDRMLPFIYLNLKAEKNLICDLLAQDLVEHAEFSSLEILINSKASSSSFGLVLTILTLSLHEFRCTVH